LFYQYPGFLKSGEDFPVKQFIPELAVKRFNITILPGTARFDIQGLVFSASTLGTTFGVVVKGKCQVY